MRRINFFLLFIFLLTGVSKAQYSDKFWCFGDSAGIDFSTLNNPIPASTGLDTRGSCTSISDSTGNLLFYANTRAATAGLTGQIRNRNHEIMFNGDSVYGAGWYFEMTIIPNPNSDNTFYLFTSGVSSYCGLYYSVIDLNQNGGLGAVTQKNVQLLGQNFCLIDGLTSVKHANGRDWWIITKSNSSANNEYYFYLASPIGVFLDHTQNFGTVLQTNTLRLNPSKDGSQIACCTADGYLTIFDFDRCSGFFTYENLIEPNRGGVLSPWYWDCELSLSKEILYVSSIYTQSDSNSYIFQYNLLVANPSLTRDSLFAIKQPITGGLLKLGPDNRMYWSCAYETPGTFPYPYPDSVRNVWNENLSYISYPDSLGAACDFHPFSFYLGGKRAYYGLPNNPNYELEEIQGSICDTITSVSSLLTQHIATMNVFYSSEWETAFINANGLKGTHLRFILTDISGRILLSEDQVNQTGFFTKDIRMGEFASGIYLVSVVTEREELTKKVVKN